MPSAALLPVSVPHGMPPHTPAQSPRLRLVMAHELRLLLAERTLWLAGALFALLICYALYNGVVQTTARDRAQAALVRNDTATRAAQLERLQRIMVGTEPGTPFGKPANPEHMGGSFGAHHVWMPSAPLAPLALGQADLYPSQFQVDYQSKVNFIHNDDIENPWNLLSGHFDLAFVVVYLLPLLIFSIGYNLLSVERENGTLRLLLSQPLALGTLLLGKVAARAAVLLGLAVLVPAGVLLGLRPGATLAAGASALWWVLLVSGYALFWFALVVAVNALGRSSATNAMLLVIGWVLVVLVAPVLLALAVTAVSPAPSRAEPAGHIRAVTADAMARNSVLLATDYKHLSQPETLVPRDGRIALAGRAMASYRIEREVDAAIQPALDRFDAQQARQQALVVRYAVLSPAAVAYEGMTALAGSGQRRHAHFMTQLDRYHAAWKQFFFSRIDAGRAVTPADFAAMPTYAWQEEEPALVGRMALRSVLQQLLPTLALLALAGWRLRRQPAHLSDKHF
ncbi:ABC transporter permease subunit [Xylophilus ampelinus]|uniref:ABC-2 type transport system permease protein n=2 Tax=Xylophilus ampelinus TaxID=54067 RepID=A0A318SU64_9BURK|nr:ABC transporter permease subunit [Xylophilus ampelinus]PYE78220.1 ABC-2 type transport system permease protein [Xylophilus ampelinus]